MRKIFYIVTLSCACACSGFLDPYPSAIRSEEYILSNPQSMEGLVGQCYSNMTTTYQDNEGAYLDCATDNAVMTSRTNSMGRFAVGVVNPTNDIFQTYWTRDYNSLYNLNLFLKDDNGKKLRYLLDRDLDSLHVRRLVGEAYALRAWFEWDLLQKFGGKAGDGKLYGFPILLEPTKDYSADFKRNSYDDCVKQIIADCDSAYAYLDIAHRDYLVTNPAWLTEQGSVNFGRFDGISTIAMKALVYLTWASPRFNPEGDMERYLTAAQLAKQVMDLKMSTDNVTGGFSPSKKVDWLDPNNPEIIFGSRYSADNSIEKYFYPASFQGSGGMGATQSLVDAFGMADGYPIGQSPTYAYDPQNPYENRDPRLYSVIFYNGRTVKTGSSSKDFSFEMWENGGKDAAAAASANTLTNYYIKKFVYMGVNFSDSKVASMPHSKFYIRWADMVLCFAEAANQYGGPLAPVGGLNARDAIALLRSRTTYDGEAGIKNDPYLDIVALSGKKAFDEFLRNERRIETCFEGKWFFDLRRWSTTLGPLNVEITRPGITRKNDGTFHYEYGVHVENRTFESAYLPIPYSEMLNIPGLIQNEGWEDWQ